MRIFSKAPFILGAAILLAGPPAFGGAGDITTVVTPISSNVTYSRNAVDKTPALVTYVGYVVQISNVSGNTINNIRFTATTSVTDLQESAIFSSAEGVSCTASAGGTSIDCSVGQLKAGSSYPPFAVFFVAPKKDTLTATPDGVAGQCDTTDCVKFSGITYYAEGTGGVPQSTPDNSTVTWAADPVTLGTTNVVNVKSAVPKGGGTLFTGAGAVATATDTWATEVVVPPTTIYTTAEILEETTPITCAPDLLTCSTSTLAIPGSFANLVIFLRRDVSTIAKNAKISSARVYYSDPQTPAVGVTYPYEVLPCTNTTTYGSLPKPGIPCIKSRTEFTKRTAPTPEWEGDWQFEIWALDNGRYVN